MADLGSLKSFVFDFPETEKYLQIIKQVKKSNEIAPASPSYASSVRAKTRAGCVSRATVFRSKSRMTGMRIKRRENFSIGKLSPGDQLRGELMLGSRHELLRSMRFNVRREERQTIEATIETRGLEKILNTLRKPQNTNELKKLKPFRPIYFSPKQAMERTLLEDRLFWMNKRGLIKSFMKL